MGTCLYCGMKDPKRTSKQIRADHQNEALAFVKGYTDRYGNLISKKKVRERKK